MSDSAPDQSPIPALAAYLAEIRRRGLTCFGSKSHQFEWNPTVTKEEVRAFELQHGIILPDDYRQFLLEAGNGGAGPDCGLLPLKRWDITSPDEPPPDYLKLPSPLTPTLLQKRDKHDWEHRLDCSVEDAFRGSITIVGRGCSYYYR